VQPSNIPRPQVLPARLRVKRAGLFQEAYAQGHKHVGKHLVLWLRDGEDAAWKLGVVASKKVGNSVVRSRAKRRMRELYRRNRQRLSGAAADIILVARHSLPEAPWPDLLADFDRVFSRAGRLQCPPDSRMEPPPFPVYSPDPL
jgi:ribonuclease P protein component